MKSDLPVDVKQKKLYASLTAQIDNGHFPNAVKTTDKLLRLDPNDSVANKTRLWLLLQTDQYAKALEATQSNDSLLLEKAYALYRLQREDEAAAAVKDTMATQDENARGALHLQAQINYRLGEYEAASDLYNELLDSCEPNSEEQTDIQTNLASTQAHIDFISTGFNTSISKLPRSLADTLEEAPPPSLAIVPSSGHTLKQQAQQAQPSAESQPQVANPIATKVKPPRKSRLPKGVVIGQTPLPDPERWLKKTERTSYQPPKSKKGRGGGGGASQGITPADAPSTTTGGGGGGGKKGKKRK